VKQTTTEPLVSTVKERCRVCYTCVRECPAKAIRISSGQAEVMAVRCIGCGNCVKVCSQQAKHMRSSIPQVQELLRSGQQVAACLAPSFPADFTEMEAETLVGMVRALGFTSVHEVAFGADLVARAYRRMLEERPQESYIATTCPAVIGYVERYHPNLVPRLMPLVSPMVAMSRALREMHGPGLKVVFIGPCLAKKAEASANGMAGEIDAVLTFGELRVLLDDEGIVARGIAPSAFDPPAGGPGALFPLSRGLLQAAGIPEDLSKGDIVSSEGRTGFQEAIRDFEERGLGVRLLEVLCCNGCIMGPGMTSESPFLSRRARVSQYVRGRLDLQDTAGFEDDLRRFEALDLTRGFAADDQRFTDPSPAELQAILERMGKLGHLDELNCGACGYDTCREHALAIHKGLAESEMCLPYTIDRLRSTVQELGVSNQQLADAQEALVHSEKLASMGQLAAGIAHEVNNPLGVVLMYTHLLLEETAENSPLREDLVTIVEQTDRAKRIVAGLLNFARQNKVEMALTNVLELAERSARAAAPPAGITVDVAHEGGDMLAQLDADQIGQVLINLLTNAYAAMPQGGTISLHTREEKGTVRFVVKDGGIGIPAENRNKIFTPFFTTKAAGQGTGLGLAVVYGIVKMHRGDIRCESNADPDHGPTGTTFTVSLPNGREPSEGEEGSQP
jgi:signal transduction histidine kinase/Fe-S-cluster-containing hydrogenase component 2